MALLKDRDRFVMMQAWSRWNKKNDFNICKTLNDKLKDANKKKAELEARDKELK